MLGQERRSGGQEDDAGSTSGAAEQPRVVPERRQAPRQPLEGGTRDSDPPLTTRACADWMGMTPSWVRAAIDEGHQVAGVGVVKLAAESLTINGRRVHRIHLDAFVTFLQAIGWQRLPRSPRRPTTSAA